MNNSKSVLIADVNSDFCAYLVRELENQPDMRVVGVASDGVDTIRQIEALGPDVVLMDTVLPKLDGIGVLRGLNRDALRNQPIIVVMSYFATEMLEIHAASLGAHYFLVKPFEIGNLLELLRYEAPEARAARHHDDTASIITQSLRDMGVPSHIKGFHYIREAILLTLNSPSGHYGITKFIYPQIAEKFSTTPSGVECAIRSAIELAWRRGDIDVHYDLFRNTVCGERGKPTNSEFISTLADHFLVQKHSHRLQAAAH